MSFPHEKDVDLMAYMSMHKEDEQGALDAWGRLYEKHIAFLHPVLGRKYGQQLRGGIGLEDFLHDLFHHVYQYAKRHSPDSLVEKFTYEDEEHAEKSFRAWLLVVAHRRFLDLFRKNAKQPLEVNLDYEQEELLTGESTPSPEVSARLQSALSELSEKERDALLVSMDFYNPETDSFSPGPGEAQALAASLSTTPEALRQNRRRAIQHVRAQFQKEGATK